MPKTRRACTHCPMGDYNMTMATCAKCDVGDYIQWKHRICVHVALYTYYALVRINIYYVVSLVICFCVSTQLLNFSDPIIKSLFPSVFLYFCIQSASKQSPYFVVGKHLISPVTFKLVFECKYPRSFFHQIIHRFSISKLAIPIDLIRQFVVVTCTPATTRFFLYCWITERRRKNWKKLPIALEHFSPMKRSLKKP